MMINNWTAQLYLKELQDASVLPIGLTYDFYRNHILEL